MWSNGRKSISRERRAGWPALVRALLCCAFIGAAARVPSPALAGEPWLFVNDVHLDTASRARGPITHGGDTNEKLLDSALREMQRLAPDPPVIVMAGDFLAHHFKRPSAVPTMVMLAQRLGRAFPHAQFVMALGNEDSPCGDYAMPTDSSFLAAVAKAWEPLVNRNGAAPDFRRTFAHDGFYTTKLPVIGVRAVVVDNAFWSTFYHSGCGNTANPAPASLDELDRALKPAGDERLRLVMHIPPGIDAASTVHLTHQLAIVPFLRPEARERVLGLIADPARHVELVVTGHVHRFAFRIVERKKSPPVPLLISPAISPIMGNMPAFLTADVGANGVIRNLEEHAFVHRHWEDIGGLRTLGVDEFSGPALTKLQHRLERDAVLRDKFAALYMGDSSWHEIFAGNWRSYWCAATAFNSTAFRECLDIGGFSFLTRRGVAVVAAAVAAVLICGALAVVLVVGNLRRRRAARAGR